MKSLMNLTRANVKSFVRDRAALFWTIAFPLIFIVLFGTIYSSGGNAHFKIGWVDEDGTPASASLHDAFASVAAFNLVTGTHDEALAAMRTGDVASVIIVPRGYGAAAAAAATGGASGAPGSPGAGSPPGPPVQLTLYVDPSQQTDASAMNGIVSAVVGRVNQGDRPTFVGVQTQAIEAQSISGTAYFVPSILAMAIMQLGLFGAIPLVQQRQKLILKRLNATPLRRWTLVGSNVLMRLFIGIVQTLLIVGVGAQLFNVSIVGNPIEVVRADRGVGQHDHEHPAVPADVPVGHLLPARAHARLAPNDCRAPAADLPRRRAPPGDGRRHAVRAAGGEHRDPRGLAGGMLRGVGALLQVAVTRRRPQVTGRRRR
jgi:ABC-type Na+ efflux pump permease subunit